jgi:hypothetical protein
VNTVYVIAIKSRLNRTLRETIPAIAISAKRAAGLDAEAPTEVDNVH